jgi:hypothetical protein
MTSMMLLMQLVVTISSLIVIVITPAMLMPIWGSAKPVEDMVKIAAVVSVVSNSSNEATDLTLEGEMSSLECIPEESLAPTITEEVKTSDLTHENIVTLSPTVSDIVINAAASTLTAAVSPLLKKVVSKAKRSRVVKKSSEAEEDSLSVQDAKASAQFNDESKSADMAPRRSGRLRK